MKCKNCGAETRNEICEYCGSEMPKEQTVIHITNNYYGDGAKESSETETAFQMDEIQPCNEKKKGAPTWVWVLGWICIFPLPLTILLLRKKDMNPKVKYGCIIVAWVVYLLIGLSGGTEEQNQSGTGDTQQMTDVLRENTQDEPMDVNAYILDVVENYNAQATEKLVYAENFTPSDKDSGHYRTEFRLAAYSDAVGVSYLLGDCVVDVVAVETYSGSVNFRVYADGVSREQVKALIQGMSPLMDETLSAADLAAALSEVETKKTANGYYYGELGMTLFGSDETGYELMIKKE